MYDTPHPFIVQICLNINNQGKNLHIFDIMPRMFKIYIAAVLWIASLAQGFSQDIGVVAKLAPNSGCQLGSSLTVTVQVFNFGATFSSPFDVSYKIDANAPVTETVNLGTFNSFSSYSHTFATNADLSITGSYVMKFYTSLAGDVNNTNDTLTITIVNDPTTVGGSLPADFAVCELGNSGTLTLTGYTGSVTDWESSTDGGTTWGSLTNTTDTQPYSNLTQTTAYRAIVKSGSCPQDYSTVVNVNVDPAAIGGNVSGPSTVCASPNSASITLSGFQGSITDWESSTDGGVTWTALGDNSNPLSQTNLTQTTSYRAIVASGTCPSEYSDTLEISVISNVNGGDLSPSLDSVCISGNSGTINLSNQQGIIDHWESSTDLISWNTLANTSTSESYNNLTTTTYYRVIISGCSTDTSTIAQINVNPISDAGSISAVVDACQGDDINLSSSSLTGNIFIWESSPDGSTWSTAGTQSTLDLLNIQNSQFVRFIAQSGACLADTTNVLTLNVSSAPSYTSLLTPDSLCISNNIDSIVYTGVNMTVVDWISSTNGGASWSSLAQTDTVLNISPTVSTSYGILVSSGTCPIDTFFNNVVVSPATVAGTIPIDTMVCASVSSIEIVNTGSVGTITWYGASNLSGPYSMISSGNDTINVNSGAYSFIYSELTSGICPTLLTDTMSLGVYSFNYGITGDTAVDQYATTTFEAFGGQTYLWDADPLIIDATSAQQSVEITDPVMFAVTITDSNSCIYRDSISIGLLTTELQIATIITPNNDGFNDAWVIIAPTDYGPIKVTVTNPFGQVVYTNDDYLSDWMGDFGGNSLPNGAYYYIVENENGEAFYGTLNILVNE